MNEILNTLKPLLADIFGVDESDVSPAVTFEELGADHEDMIEISMTAEEEFDVLIDDEDLDGIATVGELIDYIIAHGNHD